MNVSTARGGTRSAAVIGAAVLGLLIILGQVVAGGPVWGTWGLLGLVMVCTAWVLGRLMIRDIAERRGDQVDEYEADRRAEARGAAYTVALGALILNFVLLVAAVHQIGQGDSRLLLRCPHILMVSYLIAASLPTFLLVWRTRDDTADGEDPEPHGMR